MLGLLISFQLVARDFSYAYKGKTLTYTVLDENVKTCEVKNADKVSGKLSIPEIAVDGESRYSVVAIYPNAFCYCGELTSVTIPKSVTQIPYNPFQSMESFTLTEINVDGDNPKYASHEGSLYNKDLTELLAVGNGRKGNFKIPASVKAIGYGAFVSCAFLKSVTIPNSVESISSCAFYCCLRLASVTIPASVIEIGGCAFGYCNSLTEINVDSDNRRYSSFEGVLYNKDKTSLCEVPSGKKGEFVIPPSVREIQEDAFWSSKLTSVSIPASVEEIAARTQPFMQCFSLTEIKVSPDNPCYASFDGSLYNKDKSILIAVGAARTGQLVLPSSAAKIGEWALEECYKLTSVFIPSSVKEVGRYAFRGWDALESVYCAAATLPMCGENVFDYIHDDCTLYVPVGAKSVYEQADPWHNFKNIVESDFAGIDAVAASERSILLKVEHGRIFVMNKPAESAVKVYTTQGRMIAQTCSDEISGLPSGIYIVTVGASSFKVAI